MAFALTYDTLTQQVIVYSNRTDQQFVSQIPLFIMLGERRLARDLKILGLKISYSGNLYPNNSIIDKPIRWLSDSSFSIGVDNKKVFLEQRSYEWCRTYWPDPRKIGTPKYYASDYQYEVWFFVPTPDFAYPYEAIIHEFPQLIDENTNTNWLTINLPDALLYATLLETAPSLQDDSRIPVWAQEYTKIIQAISVEEMSRIYDAYSKRGG